MKPDPQITKQLQDFVNSDEEKRDYKAGALLLLKISGNKIEYQNNINNLESKKAHILKRLRQTLEFRLAALTKEQVAEMKAKAAQIVNDIPENENKYALGKRLDHDLLPEDVQAAYKEVNVILQKQKQLHLKIRSLALAEAPCPDSELYPFVKDMIEYDKKRLSLWKKYDNFKLKEPKTEPQA